jgi:1-deoxy-D-xylulose-5-phosphate reductoisomerase
MKRIALLGSTGSIGRQTLDVAGRLPDRLRIVALAGGSNAKDLAQQAKQFGASAVALYDDAQRELLETDLSSTAVERYYGPDGLEKIATRPDVDVVVVAVAGSVGTRATLAALNAGKDVALATKEVLVAAGKLVYEAAKRSGRTVLPIDSEHSALFQCLNGEKADSVARLWLTASGGPFRSFTQAQLETVTAADALNHPTWKMGPKITIDSATLMNKGLETIEARWMFDMPVDKIDVVVHPQSVVHSMVELVDGSVLAQLGLPDMRLPIEYALLYPERADLGADIPRLDPKLMGQLTFEPPDEERFPCLVLARRAASIGGTMPAVLNAANETAVGLFLEGRLPFTGIPQSIDSAMGAHEDRWILEPDIDEILLADQWARGFVAAQSLGILS